MEAGLCCSEEARPPPPTTVLASNGSCGEFEFCALAIMGDDEPMDPRWASRSRRRRRRMINQTRTPPATIARKPRTTMTAIAQCGKGELLPLSWMVLDGETDEDEEDFDDAAESDDAAEREDCDIEETTASAYVVSGEEGKMVRKQGDECLD